MTSSSAPPDEPPADHQARVSRGRILAAFIRSGLLSPGPIVLRFGSANLAQAAAKELSERAIGAKDGPKISWSPIRDDKLQERDGDCYLWIDPLAVKLPDECLVEGEAIANQLGARAAKEAARPWTRDELLPPDAAERAGDRFPPGFPITFSIGLTAERGPTRVSVTLHSPRAIDLPKGLRAFVRNLASSGCTVDTRDIGLLGNDVPDSHFKRSDADVLRPGYSISRFNGPASSIGMFVKRAPDSAEVYLIGSGHGLYPPTGLSGDMSVLFVAESHRGQHRMVAELEDLRFVPRHRSTQLVDAALARLVEGWIGVHRVPAINAEYRSPRQSDLGPSEPLAIAGCASGRKIGMLSRTDVDVDLVGQLGRVYRYVNQLEFVSKVSAVGGAGDSGGPMVDDENRYVGLITGWVRHKPGGTRNSSVFATRVDAVLEALGVTPHDLAV